MRILKVKDEAVTRGVLDKDVAVQPHLREVTYSDHNGVPHTIFVHQDGPFSDPEDAVRAHQNALIHDGPDEREAPEHAPHPAGPVLT